MRTRTLVIWMTVVALFLGAMAAMRGEGHRMLVKWLPAMHGGR